MTLLRLLLPPLYLALVLGLAGLVLWWTGSEGAGAGNAPRSLVALLGDYPATVDAGDLVEEPWDRIEVYAPGAGHEVMSRPVRAHVGDDYPGVPAGRTMLAALHGGEVTSVELLPVDAGNFFPQGGGHPLLAEPGRSSFEVDYGVRPPALRPVHPVLGDAVTREPESDADADDADGGWRSRLTGWLPFAQDDAPGTER